MDSHTRWRTKIGDIIMKKLASIAVIGAAAAALTLGAAAPASSQGLPSVSTTGATAYFTYGKKLVVEDTASDGKSAVARVVGYTGYFYNSSGKNTPGLGPAFSVSGIPTGKAVTVEVCTQDLSKNQAAPSGCKSGTLKVIQ